MQYRGDRDRFEAAHLLHKYRAEQEKSHQQPVEPRQRSSHSLLELPQENFHSQMEEFRSQVITDNQAAEPSTVLHV